MIADKPALTRSASEQDLSFIILSGPSSSSSSTASIQSLPLMTGSYHQACLSDLVNLKLTEQQQLSSQQQPNNSNSQKTAEQIAKSLATAANNVSLSSNSAAQINELIIARELAALRAENNRLFGVALKNDENLRAMVDRHQNILGKLSELTSENCLLKQEKRTLEERVDDVKETEFVISLSNRLKSVENQLMDATQQIQIMGDVNQLMQVKLLSLETKLANLGQSGTLAVAAASSPTAPPYDMSSSSPLPPNFSSLGPNIGRLYPNLQTVQSMVGGNSGVYHHHSPPLSSSYQVSGPFSPSADLQSSAGFDKNSPTNTTNNNSIGGFQEGFNNLKSKLTALVTPIKPTSFDRQLSYYGGVPMNSPISPPVPIVGSPLASLVPGTAIATAPEAATSAPSEGGESSEDSSGHRRHHHRHHRHHRIKLFSTSGSRRRQH
ncbi:hypothetical protein TYRP_009900 [Tyrophagus putrescentiae]|nr:hypothetical protein TYRP_009900 [Tyrophagus putrescentiae]